MPLGVVKMLEPNFMVVVDSLVVSSCADVAGKVVSVVIVSIEGVCCVEVDTSVVNSSDVLVFGVTVVVSVDIKVTVDVSGAGVGMTKFSGTSITKNCSDGWFAPSIVMFNGRTHGLPLRITWPASIRQQ